jgi:hypothetical protein
MQIWNWNGAANGFTTLLPVRDEDILTGVFTADGTPKAWDTRPQVVPGIERIKKKQHPLGDLSFVMGASVVLNEKAYAALKGFLDPFGQFLELDMIDETGIGGGDQRLYFYNVTNVIPCIDFDRSETEGKKVIKPAFVTSALPTGAQVFKDPLRKKMDIYLTDAAHAELAAAIARAGLRGSTFKPVG